MKSIREFIAILSPILLKPKEASITISLSKRFFLFNMMNKTIRFIEDEPYLNFLSVIKHYKILGKVLTGTVEKHYKERNSLYFKNFFRDIELYNLVKKDLIQMRRRIPNVKLTISKNGLMIYDKYKKNEFNMLLFTIHGGEWVPQDLKKSMAVTKQFRYTEEDAYTSMIYRKLFFRKNGVWIDNKRSRFAGDYNRTPERSIYHENSERWLKRKIWKKTPTEKQVKEILRAHHEFYFTLARLIQIYRFNVILDGHSMKNTKTRPNFGLGVRYTNKFYMPLVKGMQKKINDEGYGPALINKPYTSGNITRWLGMLFPDVFVFLLEINKKLYMNKSNTKVFQKKVQTLSSFLSKKLFSTGIRKKRF